MSSPVEQVEYVALREILQFGLNMSEMAALTRIPETYRRASTHAYQALRDFYRFRSGVVLMQHQHVELASMAIELSSHLLDLGARAVDM